ncbi:MAG: SDR family oxidoreductase [Deferribacterota bacterium]|nr:SDR family oxidoreductase [Deferribacterota bacterium]
MNTILITGANRGIGLETTKIFSKNNWNVIACCRNPNGEIELNMLSKNMNNIKILKLDLDNFDNIENLKYELNNTNIDILLNNAGIYGDPIGQEFGKINYESFNNALKINLLAPLKLSETLIDNVLKSNKKIIAFITSMMGSITLNKNGDEIIYRVTKAAANMAVKCLSNKLRDKKVTVLAMHPGWVKTRMGGPNAPTTAVESASGIYKVLSTITFKSSGLFIDYKGEVLPW